MWSRPFSFSTCLCAGVELSVTMRVHLWHPWKLRDFFNEILKNFILLFDFLNHTVQMKIFSPPLSLWYNNWLLVVGNAVWLPFAAAASWMHAFEVDLALIHWASFLCLRSLDCIYTFIFNTPLPVIEAMKCVCVCISFCSGDLNSLGGIKAQIPLDCVYISPSLSQYLIWCFQWSGWLMWWTPPWTGRCIHSTPLWQKKRTHTHTHCFHNLRWWCQQKN